MTQPNTPTAFSDFVFRATVGWSYHSGDGDRFVDDDLRTGEWAHYEIERVRQKNLMLERFGEVEKDYDLVFADKDRIAGRLFKASCLRYRGKPFLCRPDLVLRHKARSHMIIVDRKATRRTPEKIPPSDQGWPNIEAQLWCYSFIDDWKEVRNISLVAELFQVIGGSLLPMESMFFW